MIPKSMYYTPAEELKTGLDTKHTLRTHILTISSDNFLKKYPGSVPTGPLFGNVFRSLEGRPVPGQTQRSNWIGLSFGLCQSNACGTALLVHFVAALLCFL